MSAVVSSLVLAVPSVTNVSPITFLIHQGRYMARIRDRDGK